MTNEASKLITNVLNYMSTFCGIVLSEETTTEVGPDWRRPEERERDIAQAKALREQARRGGLRFEVFLPPSLAEWILDFVARGLFTSPSDAAFVMLGEQRDLEPHADLRREILKRSLQASIDDPRPPISQEDFEEDMRKRRDRPRAEPALGIKGEYGP